MLTNVYLNQFYIKHKIDINSQPHHHYTMTYFIDSPLGQTTIHIYEIRINKWLHLVPEHAIEFIILYPRQSIRLLTSHLRQREVTEKKVICTLTNIRNFIIPIIAILRYSPHIAPTIPDRLEYYHLWLQIRDQINQPIHTRQLQQLPTDNQIKKGGSKLTFSDLIQARDNPDLSMYSHLLLSMYTYIYPVRSDYYATEIITDDRQPVTPNYIRICPSSSELMIRDFKTSKQYTQIHYSELPSELHQIIIQSLQHTPRTYLFEKNNGQPYTRTSFSQWASQTLQQIFGVEMNLTMIRHHFISTLSMELPAIELQRIGNLMGHSIARQRLYKWHLHDQHSSDDDDEDE